MDIQAKLLRTTQAAFTRPGVEALVSSVFAAYREADDAMRRWPRKTAADLYPQYRRAVLEEKLITFAERMEGWTAIQLPNATRSSFHVELSHENLCITQSAVTHKEQVVREAGFRQSLSRQNIGQLELFPTPKTDMPVGRHYALLLHGAHPHKWSEPAFVRLAYPDADQSSYLLNIDVITTFRIDTSEFRVDPKAIHTVPDKLNIPMKSKAKRVADK